MTLRQRFADHNSCAGGIFAAAALDTARTVGAAGATALLYLWGLERIGLR